MFYTLTKIHKYGTLAILLEYSQNTFVLNAYFSVACKSIGALLKDMIMLDSFKGVLYLAKCQVSGVRF